MKCEQCENEHDGSYGTGRFCSDHCRRRWCGIRSANSKKHHFNMNFSSRLPLGTWKCGFCGMVFSTRRELESHKRSTHTKNKYKCKFCGKEFDFVHEVACHTSHCEKNPNHEKIIEASRKECKRRTGKKFSDEIRRKFSISKKAYYAKNPDKLFFRMYHSSNKSYAEKYFEQLFKKEKITGFIRELSVDRFFLDFAFVEDKIDFEVDGSQHYTYQKMIDHDKERSGILESLGWKVIRIRWSVWAKMTVKEKNNWLKHNLYCHLKQFSAM